MWPKNSSYFPTQFRNKSRSTWSLQASWVPPALPNGVITHYVINVNPLDPSEKSWTVNVGANMNSGYDKTVEAVVDNLVGGQSYQINSQAVTEAGIGDLPAASDSIRIEMPIMGMF
uniref:Fibronectin type-III domain-containing protein n=1 Tax=Panagrolaimus superbus TaxID=310955 RepID=A0A914Y4E0_9BILA